MPCVSSRVDLLASLADALAEKLLGSWLRCDCRGRIRAFRTRRRRRPSRAAAAAGGRAGATCRRATGGSEHLRNPECPVLGDGRTHSHLGVAGVEDLCAVLRAVHQYLVRAAPVTGIGNVLTD